MADLQLCFERLAQIEDINSQTGASLLGHISRLSGVAIELIADDVEGVLSAIAQVNFKTAECGDRQAPELNSGEPVTQKHDSTSAPTQEKETEEPITLQDYQYQLVTSIVNAELAIDLESAVKIASELPYKDIEGYLKARIKFLNRHAEKEAEEKKELEQASSKLVEELESGDFFGDDFFGQEIS